MSVTRSCIKNCYSAGVAINIGPKLPAMLRRAGIQDIELKVVQPAHMYGEGKLMAPVTVSRIADALTGEGPATESEVQHILTELITPPQTPRRSSVYQESCKRGGSAP